MAELIQAIWSPLSPGQLTLEGRLVLLFVMTPMFIWLWVRRSREGQVSADIEQHVSTANSNRSFLDDRKEWDSQSDEDKRGRIIDLVPAQGAVKKALLAIFDLREQANPPIAAVVGTALSAETQSLRGLRAYPNAFILVGLLGTVLGLAGSISNLAPQIAQAANAATPAELANSLSSTLQFMKSAFGCTLWGILMALAANQIVLGIQHRRSKVLSEAEFILVSTFAPKILPRSTNARLLELQQKALDQLSRLGQLEQSVKELKEAAAGFKQAADGLTGTSKQLTGAASSLEQASGQVSSSVGKLAENVRALEAIQQNEVAELQKIRQSLVDSLQANQKELSDRLEEVRKALLDSVKKLSDEIVGSNRQVIDIMRDGAKDFDKNAVDYRDAMAELFRDSNTQVSHELQDVIGRVQSISTQLGLTQEAFKEVGETQSKQWQEVQLVLQSGFESLKRGLADNNQEIKSTLVSIGGVLEPLQRLEKSLDDQRKAFDKTAKQVENSYSQLPGSVETALKRFSELAIQELPKIQKQASEDAAKSFESVRSDVQSILENFRHTESVFREVGSDQIKLWAQLQSPLGAQFSALKNALDEQTKMLGRLDVAIKALEERLGKMPTSDLPSRRISQDPLGGNPPRSGLTSEAADRSLPDREVSGKD